MPLFADSHGMPASFCMNMEEGWIEGIGVEVGERSWRRGGRGGWHQEVK